MSTAAPSSSEERSEPSASECPDTSSDDEEPMSLESPDSSEPPESNDDVEHGKTDKELDDVDELNELNFESDCDESEDPSDPGDGSEDSKGKPRKGNPGRAGTSGIPGLSRSVKRAGVVYYVAQVYLNNLQLVCRCERSLEVAIAHLEIVMSIKKAVQKIAKANWHEELLRALESELADRGMTSDDLGLRFRVRLHCGGQPFRSPQLADLTVALKVFGLFFCIGIFSVAEITILEGRIVRFMVSTAVFGRRNVVSISGDISPDPSLPDDLTDDP